MFIVVDSPHQLNISSCQRAVLLKALETTTHPSVFKVVAADIETALRTSLHPNFIRYATRNGNKARIIFARCLGVFLILAGLVTELLLTLSSVPRGYRALGAIGLVIGIATLIAACRGMCVVLHGLHHRHFRPWELFSSGPDKDTESYSLHESMQIFGPSNEFEDASWVARYQKRNLVRKIFDKETWIQEPALRQIQDMVFLQSILVALLISGVITVIFLIVPQTVIL